MTPYDLDTYIYAGDYGMMKVKVDDQGRALEVDGRSVDALQRMIDLANPKDRIGVTKAPVDYFPPVAILQGSRAMRHGADKYGRANWRDYPVKRTVYLGAALRHILADLDGETIDPDTITPDNPTGTPHMAMALAGLGIALDADAIGNLIDDRPKPGGFSKLAAQYFPPKVQK